MEELEKYYALLELAPNATIDDIRRNYRNLKNLYAGDSIEIRALKEDFLQEMREEYLGRLEEAFEKLNALPEKNRMLEIAPVQPVDEELKNMVAQVECFTGAALRSIRERMNIDLKAMFSVTRIQIHFLEDLENEVFASFRAEVYLRSYLIEYARFLALDTQKVLDDYLGRYRQWVAKQ
jgi:Helix-turn-helix domain